MEIPISRPLIGSEEKEAVIDCLKTDRYSMGVKTLAFEEAFARYVGKRFGVMVNSGSSALLAMFAVLRDQTDRKVVICPAVGWSTDYSSMNMFGFRPHFVDISDRSLQIDVSTIDDLFTDHYYQSDSLDIAAIMPIHILGQPSDSSTLHMLSLNYDVQLLEDCCEAHGSISHNQKVGSFGNMSVFSFFLSHILTSIEGGMILTDDERTADLLRMYRAHGWTREVRNTKIDTHGIDKRFYFQVPGFNIRPTELNAAVGLEQLKKLDKFIDHRMNVHDELNNFIKPYDKVHVYDGNERVSWLGYPMLTQFDNKQKLVNHLEKNGICTRPIASGDIRLHNMMNYIKFESRSPLFGTESIQNNCFFINGHLSNEEIDYVKKILAAFFEGL